MTELIEPSEAVSSDAVQNLMAHIQAKLHTYKGVALCGTYPPGTTFNISAARLCVMTTKG
jgi:fructose-1-phosphate kinase PfkB-like protein